MDEKKELINGCTQQNRLRFFDLSQRRFDLCRYPLTAGLDLIPQLKLSGVHHLTISGEQWATCNIEALLNLLNELSSSKITSLSFDWSIFKSRIPGEIKKIFALFEKFHIKKLAVFNIYGDTPDVTLKLYIMLNSLQQSRIRCFIWEGKKSLFLNSSTEQNFLYPFEKMPRTFRQLKISNLCLHQGAIVYLSSLFKGLNLANITKLDFSYNLTQEINLSRMFHSIGDMPLKFLYLKGNKLELKSLENIYKLKSLEYLDLEENAINTQSLDLRAFFANIKKSRIKFIGLQKNKLAEIKLDTLSKAFEELAQSNVIHVDLSNNGFFSSPNYPVFELKLLIYSLPKTIRTITFHATEFPQSMSDPLNPKEMKRKLWLQHFPEPMQIILYQHHKLLNPLYSKNRQIYSSRGLPASTFVQLISFNIVHNPKSFTVNHLLKLPEEMIVKIQESKNLMDAISFANCL